MKIIFLGVGEVAKCTLHLIRQFFPVDAHKLYFVERENEREHRTVKAFTEAGAHYLQVTLTRENINEILVGQIGMQSGDFLVDLATDTDMFYTVEVALKHGWLYLNTCIENSADAQLIHHDNHEKMAQLLKRMAVLTKPATCVFDHGMNPGLISAFVKKGLADVAASVPASRMTKQLQDALAHRDFSTLARLLGLEVLHCSELDDQRAAFVPQDVFVNTWSCAGFLVEAKAPMQVSWGTHEGLPPENGKLVRGRNFISQIPAWQTLARSYVPHREIRGMVIPHEEVITLRKLLETPGYAPTICYVYEINPHTSDCFAAGILTEEGGKVLTPAANRLQGTDKVGALLIFKENPLTGEKKPWAYWCGTILETIDPLFSATVIQVAAGVLAAMRWMLENPQSGVLFPEDLPHEKILEYAAPHLGQMFSDPVDFHPVGTEFGNFFISVSETQEHRLQR